MRNRLAWIALLAAPAVIVGLAALLPATPDAERAAPVVPPPRDVSPRPAPPVQLQVADESLPPELPPPRDPNDTTPASVRGRIVYPSSDHPVLARVALVPVDVTNPPDVGRLAAADIEDWTETPQQFDFTGVAPGRYLVGVSFLDGTVGASRIVNLAPGDKVLCDLTVPALDVHEDVLVRVVGPDGRAVAGADVQAGFSVSGGDTYRTGSVDLDTYVRTGEDGTARVHHDAPGAPRTGMAGSERVRLVDRGRPVSLTHFVDAVSANFPRTRVVYDPRRDRDVTIRFPAPAWLSVTVEGLPTNPDCDRLRLVLVPKSGGREVGQTYVRDGRFEFDPMIPGDYELRLEVARRDEPGVVLSQRDLTLTESPQAISLAIPNYVTLTVASPTGVRLDPSSFLLVRIAGARRDRVDSTATRDGQSVVFPKLRSGRFCLSYASKPAAGEMTFDATDDLRLEWRPAAPNALRVELDGLRGEAEWRYPRLASGDLVVAIDGVRCWSDGDPIDGMNARLNSKGGRCIQDTVPLTVVHHGKEFETSSVPGWLPSPDWLRPATR